MHMHICKFDYKTESLFVHVCGCMCLCLCVCVCVCKCALFDYAEVTDITVTDMTTISSNLHDIWLRILQFNLQVLINVLGLYFEMASVCVC